MHEKLIRVSLKLFSGLAIGFILLTLSSSLPANPVYAKPAKAPDLTVQFDPSPFVVPGNQVTVTTTVTNTARHGDLTDTDFHLIIATFSQYDPVFVSADNGYTCVRTSGGRYSTPQYDCTGAVIPADSSAKIVYKVDTPDVVSNATTYYSASAYMLNYDVITSDNVLVAPYYAPELRAVATPDKYQVVLGDTATFSVYVFNGGYLPSGPTTLTYQLPDGSTGEINIPELAAKEIGSTLTFSYVTTQSGYNTATFTVDPDNVVDEYDETNNTTSAEVFVSEELPDLVVSLEVPPSVGTWSVMNETATVANQGNAPAANVYFKVTFSGPYEFEDVGNFVADHGFICNATYGKHWSLVRLTGYECSGGSLGAGESANVFSEITTPFYAGTYANYAEVDKPNYVVESNEDNNTSSVSFEVI